MDYLKEIMQLLYNCLKHKLNICKELPFFQSVKVKTTLIHFQVTNMSLIQTTTFQHPGLIVNYFISRKE